LLSIDVELLSQLESFSVQQSCVPLLAALQRASAVAEDLCNHCLREPMGSSVGSNFMDLLNQLIRKTFREFYQFRPLPIHFFEIVIQQGVSLRCSLGRYSPESIGHRSLSRVSCRRAASQLALGSLVEHYW
jgi:hypothetical protein